VECALIPRRPNSRAVPLGGLRWANGPNQFRGPHAVSHQTEALSIISQECKELSRKGINVLVRNWHVVFL